MSDMELNFAEQFKILLDRKGIAMVDVANKLGTTKQNLSQKLKRGNLREKEMKELVEAIGCEVEIKIINK